MVAESAPLTYNEFDDEEESLFLRPLPIMVRARLACEPPWRGLTVVQKSGFSTYSPTLQRRGPILPSFRLDPNQIAIATPEAG